MPDKREILILTKIIVSVNHKDGVHARIEKHPVRKTDLSYVPVPFNWDDPTFSHAKGFHPLDHRVPLDSLMKVQESRSFNDSPTAIYRHIYFFEESLGEAKVLIAQSIDKQINLMQTQMTALHNFWVNRNK